MKPVQNTSLNQSYYDPADDVCSAAPTVSSSGVGTTTPAGGRSSGVKPEPPPRGTAPLVDAYYQGQGGTAAAPSDAPGAPIPTDDSTGGAATLCERRLAANRLICGVGGSLIVERFGIGGLKGASAAYAISDACVSLADWLEHNAPLGACEE